MKRYCSILLFVLCAVNAYAESWKEDPSETVVGIHLLTDYGSGHQLLSQELSEKKIREEIYKLEWQRKFYQLVVVTEPGISMEVGGSMNPNVGLSAMYRNRRNRIDAVIISPPSTVDEMAEILIAFLREDESWKKEYEFEFTKY
jgi:hypothetical protein